MRRASDERACSERDVIAQLAYRDAHLRFATVPLAMPTPSAMNVGSP